MTEFKKLQFEDKVQMKDDFNKNKVQIGMKGRVVVKDFNGNTILEKDNLITLRLRTYILELLFGVKPPEDSGYINDHSRTIALFKIGQGGADVNGSPFNPLVPKFSDTDLYQAVPFIIEDPDKYNDPNKKANPSIVEQMSLFDKNKYYLPVGRADGSKAFYGKIFEADNNRWRLNKSTGEVYQLLTMRIEPNEARGFMINEIGLVLAKYDKNNNTYSNEELATRITFDTESLTSLSKGLIIEYYVYA